MLDQLEDLMHEIIAHQTKDTAVAALKLESKGETKAAAPAAGAAATAAPAAVGGAEVKAEGKAAAEIKEGVPAAPAAAPGAAAAATENGDVSVATNLPKDRAHLQKMRYPPQLAKRVGGVARPTNVIMS